MKIMVTERQAVKIFTSAGRMGGQIPSSKQKTQFKKRFARNGRLKRRLVAIDNKLKTLEKHNKQEQIMRKQLRVEYRKLRALS